MAITKKKECEEKDKNEIGCWVRLRLMRSCISSKSKVDSSISSGVTNFGIDKDFTTSKMVLVHVKNIATAVNIKFTKKSIIYQIFDGQSILSVQLRFGNSYLDILRHAIRKFGGGDCQSTKGLLTTRKTCETSELCTVKIQGSSLRTCMISLKCKQVARKVFMSS